MPVGDRLVAQELYLFAVDDRRDVGGAELRQSFLALLDLGLVVVLMPPLLVLGEGLVERGSEDRLVELFDGEDLFLLLLQICCDVQRVLPDVNHHLLALLELLAAQLVVLVLGADRRLLEGVGVEERLRSLVVVLLLVEEVLQRLLDVDADLVHLDLVWGVDAHLLDPRPDVILVGVRVLQRAQ